MSKILTFVLVFTMFAALPFAVHAADSDLDPSFGTHGKVTAEFAGGNDSAYAITSDSLGRIIVAGYASVSTPGGNDFAILRCNPDGSLDSTFGGSGKLTVDFGDNETAYAVAIQPLDQKIVLGGSYGSSPSSDFALARLNPDGTPDLSFGVGGKVTLNLGLADTDDAITALVIDPSGKIVAGGRTTAGGGSGNFAIARFNSDGTLDTTFSNGGRPGVTVVDFFTKNDTVSAITLDASGKILAVGSAYNDVVSDVDVAMVRLDANGALDSTFGTGGKVTTHVPGSSPQGIALQADGKILIASSTFLGTGHLPVVLRYNTDGTMDSSFGLGGIATINPGSGLSGYLEGIGLQSDGKIVASGLVQDIATLAADFIVTRLNTDGTADPAFGNGGVVVTDISGGVDLAYALLVQSNGGIVAAGYAQQVTDSTTNFALARYGCLFCDDFETLSVDPSKWTVVKADFSQSGGNFVGTPEGKKALAEGTGFSGCTNCTFETTMSSDGGASNKLFFYSWYVDKKNTVEVLMKQENGKFVIKQLAGGATAAKEKAVVTINPGQFYKVKVIYDGATFTLNIDGADVASIPATGTPFGTAALAVKNTTGRFGYMDVN